MLPSMRKKIFISTEEKNLITIDEKIAVLINQAKKINTYSKMFDRLE